MNTARLGELAGGVLGRAPWAAPFLLYCAFAVAVFIVQGDEPLLGADHISYFQLADTIMASCPFGDYWRETNSVRTFGVLLAHLHAWTGSHVLSMKVLLAIFTVLYLLAAQLFFSPFTRERWQAVLFALLSGFAVSFGIASWGVTDSTALLPRTLVAPVVMLSLWFWFRHDGRPFKYLTFTFLVFGSLLHLGAFYVIGVLVVVELIDLVILRRGIVDRRFAGFVGGLALAAAMLFALEYEGVSNRVMTIQSPLLLRSLGYEIYGIDLAEPPGCRKAPPAPAAAQDVAAKALKEPPKAKGAKQRAAKGKAAPAPPPPSTPPDPVPVASPKPMTAREAWAIELSLRPWRNMPLPMVNVANALSSSALILLLALAGVVAAKRAGFTRDDKLMAAMLVAVPLFAFGPQTILWVLRNHTGVFPATIEEVRAISLIMVPALYFILRLFMRVLEAGGPRAPLKAGAIVVAVLALPLTMKGLPHWAREGLLSAMVAMDVVDPASSSSVANARAALGLSASTAPFYYSTQGVRGWLAANTPIGARILTHRDDMILLRNRTVVGTRQVGATLYFVTPEHAEVFLRTNKAMATGQVEPVTELARKYNADYVVVPWRVEGAPFADENFSVLAVEKTPGGRG